MQTTIKVRIDTHEELSLVSDAQGTSMAELIRVALHEYVTSHGINVEKLRKLRAAAKREVKS